MKGKNIALAFGTGLNRAELRGSIAEFVTALSRRGYSLYADDIAQKVLSGLGNERVFPLGNQIGDPGFCPTIFIVDAAGVLNAPILNSLDDWHKAGTFVVEVTALADCETCNFILPLLSLGLDSKVSGEGSLGQSMSEASVAFYDHFQACREAFPAIQEAEKKLSRGLVSISDALGRLEQDAGVVQCVRSAVSTKGWQLLRDWLLLLNRKAVSDIHSGRLDT